MRGADALTLHDTPRVSVLHASLMQYLLRLAHERYQILAAWPDFTQMYGKDFYYRWVGGETGVAAAGLMA